MRLPAPRYAPEMPLDFLRNLLFVLILLLPASLPAADRSVPGRLPTGEMLLPNGRLLTPTGFADPGRALSVRTRPDARRIARRRRLHGRRRPVAASPGRGDGEGARETAREEVLARPRDRARRRARLSRRSRRTERPRLRPRTGALRPGRAALPPPRRRRAGRGRDALGPCGFRRREEPLGRAHPPERPRPGRPRVARRRRPGAGRRPSVPAGPLPGRGAPRGLELGRGHGFPRRRGGGRRRRDREDGGSSVGPRLRARRTDPLRRRVEPEPRRGRRRRVAVRACGRSPSGSGRTGPGRRRRTRSRTARPRTRSRSRPTAGRSTSRTPTTTRSRSSTSAGTSRAARTKGFIPSGWYPTALALSSDGKTLWVANAKGGWSWSNAVGGPEPGKKDRDAWKKTRTIPGSVSRVDVPSAESLAALTARAYANRRPAARGAAPVKPSAVVPAAPGGVSPIRHVVYVIRENRTYDQVLGDLPRGNGDASLTLFGREITPNAHALADEFVLLDNLYCDAEVSADGHNWSMGAYATDFVEKVWPPMYGNKGFSLRLRGERRERVPDARLPLGRGRARGPHAAQLRGVRGRRGRDGGDQTGALAGNGGRARGQHVSRSTRVSTSESSTTRASTSSSRSSAGSSRRRRCRDS